MTTDLETLRLSLAAELAASVKESIECEGQRWLLYGQMTRVSLEIEVQRDEHLLITIANSLVIETDEPLTSFRNLLSRFDRDHAVVVTSSSQWGHLYWWIEVGGVQVISRQYAGWSWRSRSSRTHEKLPLHEGGTYL